MTVEQFRAANQTKVELDRASAGLVERQNTLQQQINDFEGSKGRLQVCIILYEWGDFLTNGSKEQIEELSIARLTAQQSVQYYEKKLRDEDKEVKNAEATAADVQKEFEVRLASSVAVRECSADSLVPLELDAEGTPVLRAVGEPTQSR